MTWHIFFRMLICGVVGAFLIVPVAGGLRSGKLAMGGRFGPAYTITRKRNPLHYWLSLAVTSAFAIAAFWYATLIFLGPA